MDGQHDHPENAALLAALEAMLAAHGHPLEPHGHPLEPHEHLLPPHTHSYAAVDHTHPGGNLGHWVLGPTGNNDSARLQELLATLPPWGGMVEMVGGTWDWRQPVVVPNNNVKLIGHGRATRIVPATSFPAGEYCIQVYAGETRPVSGCIIRDLWIDGLGKSYPNMVHGIDFCAMRSQMSHVEITWLTGDGLTVRKILNTPEDPDGWDNYETMLMHLRIGNNGRYGIVAQAADQHWSDSVIYCSAVNNLYSTGLGGVLVDNCHWYGGPMNTKNTQTVNNIRITNGCSNTQFTGCKFEQSAEAGVWLDGTVKGGSVEFVGCRFRNAGTKMVNNSSGVPVPTYPQLRATRGGGNTWEILVSGCRFWADKTTPKYAIEIVGDSAVNSNVTGCIMKNWSTAATFPAATVPGKIAFANNV